MFGIYLHFPFCRKRCPYCDFAISVRKEIPHERYYEAVKRELLLKAPLFANRPLSSIYLGGGTPSLWHPEYIRKVISDLRFLFPKEQSALEITIECDPFDFLHSSDDLLLEWIQAGINRISMGIQSFSDHSLQKLGRLHTATDAKKAVQRAQQAGFRNISLDLMIGLPQQTLEELTFDIREFVHLRPTHISIYQLTVEQNTSLNALVRKGKVREMPKEEQALMYEYVQEFMQQSGYLQYEISNYALQSSQDFRSVHNRIYWNFGEYMGLGVSAHSFRQLPNGAGERFANVKSTETYLNLYDEKNTEDASLLSIEQFHEKQMLSLYEHRSKEALAKEALWLGLRQMEGVSRILYASQHSFDPVHMYQDTIELLQKKGWVLVESDRIKLSPTGILFADEVGSYLV